MRPSDASSDVLHNGEGVEPQSRSESHRLSSWQGIKLLYVTIVVSLPAFLSILCIIILIFFVFAFIGVQVRS